MLEQANGVSATIDLPFTDPGKMQSLTLVQIAEELEKITSLIEGERVEEREARKVYQVIADRVNARVDQIKKHGQALLAEQQRRANSFNGLLGNDPPVRTRSSRPVAHPAASGPKKNISEAIVAIWRIPDYQEPLTTEEIADALQDVGYESKAAPRSLKSTLNQTLAKLCRDGTVLRYRLDGTPIDPEETKARARKYKLASLDL